MSSTELPIEDLPIWAHLNDVAFLDAKVEKSDGKGYGVVCQKKLSTQQDTSDRPILLIVPHTLVLNHEAVEEYAKEDRNFKQLLEAVGHRSPRADILLFLLVQTSLASRTKHTSVGVSNPWTEYLRFLPRDVLVPTLWNEDERLLLRGTSLDVAINAKMTALTAEFDAVQSSSSDIPCWNELLWENKTVSFRDWVRLDALYRSRCLELPRSGESMVPCIDMINHSAEPTAYYDENTKDDVVLLVRPGVDLGMGEEVTISYGESKSAAEMLFSYGFIDPASTVESIVLPLEPFDDDPLAKAKLVGFGEPPRVHLKREGSSGSTSWKSPFVHLMCVNEEDGLEFRVLQDTEGGRQLRIFWQEDDVTDRAKDFESLLQGHPLHALFRLRAVIAVQECLQSQLEQAESYEAMSEPGDVRPGCLAAAQTLRTIEEGLLKSGIQSLEEEKTLLLEDESVVAYLESIKTTEPDQGNEETADEPEDFS